MACVAFGQNRSDVPDTASDTLIPRFLFGPVALVAPGSESTDLTIPTLFADCGTIRGGSSFSWLAGGLFELPFSGSLSAQLRVTAGGIRGSLRTQVVSDNPVRDPSSSSVVPAVVDHVVDFNETFVEGALLARVGIAGRFRGQGGITLARSLSIDQTYRQVAISPSTLLFSNNSRELEVISGTLYRQAPVILGLQLGVVYDLPISARSTLSPEISLSLPLTSRTPDGAWRSLALRGGIALRFGVARPAPKPPVIDTPIIASLTPKLVTAIVTEPQVVTVRIDEYDSAEVLPMLNQIFFEERSADLRDVYRRLDPEATRSFTNAQLVGSALDVYYHILNIVGRRMREIDDATIVINGYRNGREADPSIALGRAETIRRYLTEVWNIPPRRIKVKGGALPPNPSRENTREGYEENARAEIVPSDPNILAPIYRRHIQRIASPPAITFYPRAIAEAGIAQWKLETVEKGKGVWKTFEGNGMPPDSITWNWRSNTGTLPTLPMGLSYAFTVVDSTRRSTTTSLADIDVAYHSVQQKLENRQNDTTIESYSLLLFNFDSPRVSGSDEGLLQVIASAIKKKARVRLIGYTDSLGEERHNRELATMRAREVEKVFEKLVPEDVSIVVDESGGERERFPYTTPEGRSHCRTVIIDVRTPTLPDGS